MTYALYQAVDLEEEISATSEKIRENILRLKKRFRCHSPLTQKIVSETIEQANELQRSTSDFSNMATEFAQNTFMLEISPDKHPAIGSWQVEFDDLIEQLTIELGLPAIRQILEDSIARLDRYYVNIRQ